MDKSQKKNKIARPMWALVFSILLAGPIVCAEDAQAANLEPEISGQDILPPKAARSKHAVIVPAGVETYTVQKGDWLWKIFKSLKQD